MAREGSICDIILRHSSTLVAIFSFFFRIAHSRIAHSRMFRLVKTVLVLSMCFHVVQSFYFPGVAPNEFELGTELTIKVGTAQRDTHTRTVHTRVHHIKIQFDIEGAYEVVFSDF